MPTICIFGDSITYGAFDSEQGGWVARLKRYFSKTSDYNIRVYNLGVSADNTDDLSKRFEVECQAREPDIIIFAIGINDSQYVDSKNNPRIPLEKFRDNLNELIKQAKKFTQKVIFIGLTKVDESKTKPVSWNTRKYYDNENLIKYNSVIKSICEENKLLFVGMLDLLNKDDLSDGLHPNLQGHQKIFERIKDFLLSNKII